MKKLISIFSLLFFAERPFMTGITKRVHIGNRTYHYFATRSGVQQNL